MTEVICAVAGLVMVSKEAIVYEQGAVGKHGYKVQVDGQTQYFKEADDAQRFAERSVRTAATLAAQEAGAVDPLVNTTTRVDGSLRRFLAKAVGAPGVEHIGSLARPLRKSPAPLPVRERSN